MSEFFKTYTNYCVSLCNINKRNYVMNTHDT